MISRNNVRSDVIAARKNFFRGLAQYIDANPLPFKIKGMSANDEFNLLIQRSLHFCLRISLKAANIIQFEIWIRGNEREEKFEKLLKRKEECASLFGVIHWDERNCLEFKYVLINYNAQMSFLQDESEWPGFYKIIIQRLTSMYDYFFPILCDSPEKGRWV